MSGGYKLRKSYAKCISPRDGCISQMGSEAAKDWPLVNSGQAPTITLFACISKCI